MEAGEDGGTWWEPNESNGRNVDGGDGAGGNAGNEIIYF